MSDLGPIFILGLQRGGTNQVLNALRSHPSTIWPDGELHEVLRPRRSTAFGALTGWARYLPLMVRKNDVLNPRRKPVPLDDKARAWIAAGLQRVTKANLPEVKRYKSALAEHGLAPAHLTLGDRMLVKLVNYNVGLAQDLVKMYPNATFVGIMRDPFGICESMMARGDAPEKILPLYRYVGQTLLDLEEAGLPVTTIRLEDMVEDFKSAMLKVYEGCNLDLGEIKGICLQSKERILDADGKIIGTEKVDKFHTFETVNSHMRRDVNAQAMATLPHDVIEKVINSCAPIMDRFGYVAPKLDA